MGGMLASTRSPPPRPAPHTERPAQQNIQGHGNNPRAWSRPRQVMFFQSHGGPSWSHDQTSAPRPGPAPRPPVSGLHWVPAASECHIQTVTLESPGRQRPPPEV